MTSFLNISIGSLPVMYLGIPLSNNKLKARDFGPLIENIHKKFNHWKNKLLNVSGRIELVNIVIHPMIQLWIRISQIPGSITKRINSLCANFIWKQKHIKSVGMTFVKLNVAFEK